MTTGPEVLIHIFLQPTLINSICWAGLQKHVN